MERKDGGKKFTAVRKLTDNKFLNLYEMDALTNKGEPFHYFFATRNKEETLPVLTGKLLSNGIVIYPIWKDDPQKIVMIRQYRYPLDKWIYELPAGLIDEGETASQAAVREMTKEQRLAVDQLLTANKESNSIYSQLAYIQGVKDCANMLKRLNLI